MNFKDTSKLLITCSKGIAPYLATELDTLGFPIVQQLNLGVFTTGCLDDSILLNLRIRTGLRVLYLLKEFTANNPDQLYREVAAYPWENVLFVDGYVSVTSSVVNDSITDNRFANLKVKDAIVDRIQKKFGQRPDSGPDRSKAVVFLYWRGKHASLFIDTTGEPLSRRGYRKIPGAAPMQETLAAATVCAAEWEGDSHFMNPMCGSGTLGIEAALIALNKAPGLLRHNFGFMHIKNFTKELYQKLRAQLRNMTHKNLQCRIILSDHDANAITIARKNAQTAGVDHLLEFYTCDFRDTPLPQEPGIVFLNPPYGVRLHEQKALGALYKDIGDFLKQKCTGKTGYVFTGNLKHINTIGLKTRRRLIFYNGTIESRLLEYTLYKGSGNDKNRNHSTHRDSI